MNPSYENSIDLLNKLKTTNSVKTKHVKIGDMEGYWFGNEEQMENSIVLLYLHGGGYISGNARQSSYFFSQLIQDVATREGVHMGIFSLEYDLAPQRPFPRSIEQTVKAYKWLLSQNWQPNQIIVAGDSAGGGLALACALKLRELKLQMPVGLVLISPWVNMATTAKSYTSNSDILKRHLIENWSELYLQGESKQNYLVSPIYSNLVDLPSMLVIAGKQECFMDDIEAFCQKAESVNISVNKVFHPYLYHIYCLFPFVDTDGEAIRSISNFVIQRTSFSIQKSKSGN